MRPREERKPKKRWKLLVLCYLAALLVWLVLCGLRLGRDTLAISEGTLAPTTLTMDDFVMEGFVYTQYENTFASTDPDPKLIYTPEGGAYVTRFVFKARPLTRGAGETVLYYTTAPGEDFSDAKKLWARQDAAGNWYFDLHGKTVYSLRLDPDTMGGVFWKVDGFTLNAAIAPAAYFVPGVQAAALLLLAPLLAWAVISELAVFLHPLLARRRFEKRWNQLS